MIDTSQLRIGNYISVSGSLSKITTIKNGSVCIDSLLKTTNNPSYPYEYKVILATDDIIKPIVLTDECLQNFFGAIPTTHGRVFLCRPGKATYLIYKDEESEGYFIGINFRGEIIRVTPSPFFTLHELQNIYFSMYREEMVIEENKLRMVLRCSSELS